MKFIFFRLIMLIASVIATITGAVLLRMLLDEVGLEPLRHIVGTAGSILLLVSFVYSLRKRKILFKSGGIKHWLIVHEWLAIVGAGFIFVHGGFYAHAIVPLLTSCVMFVAVVSGLTGRHLYLYANEELRQRKRELEEKGLTSKEVDESVSLLIMASGIMKHWRTVHIPIVVVLAFMAIFHVVSALYYDGFWR